MRGRGAAAGGSAHAQRQHQHQHQLAAQRLAGAGTPQLGATTYTFARYGGTVDI